MRLKMSNESALAKKLNQRDQEIVELKKIIKEMLDFFEDNDTYSNDLYERAKKAIQ